jgi:tetratricopeptide (TPR) repeat protein
VATLDREVRTLDEFEECVELEDEGNWSQAAEAYAAVAAGDGQDRIRAHALLRRVMCLLESGTQREIDAAEVALGDAEPLLERLDSPTLDAQLLLQQGRLLDAKSRVDRALQRYRDARALLGPTQEVDIAEIDLEIASAERRSGELKLAYDVINQIPDSLLPERLYARYLDEKGAVLLARGDFQKARKVLEPALELDTRTASAYAGASSRLLLAEAYLRTGESDRAQDLIEEAIRACKRAKGDKGLSEAYAMLGLLHEDREEYLLATKCFQESYDIDQRSGDDLGRVRAKRRLARVARKAGDYEGARELLKDANDRLPPEEQLERVRLRQEEGELALSGPKPDYDQAIELFERALRSAQENGDERIVAIAKRNLARAHRENDDLQAAQDLLLEAKSALEEREDLRELDDLLDDLGEVYLEQDEYELALDALEQSLELDLKLERVGSRGRSLILLGRVKQEMGEAEAARDHFEEAVRVYRGAEHGVGRSEALHHLGSWHLEHGAIGPAIDHLREGLVIDGRLNDTVGLVRAKRLLAAAHRFQGNFERAEEYLDEAQADLSHVEDEAETAYLLMERGKLELTRRRYPEAEARLRETIEALERLDHREGDVATAERFLALALAHRGAYGEALDLLDAAEKVFLAKKDYPELDELYDDRAEVHLEQGDYRRAEEDVAKSLEQGSYRQSSVGEGRSRLLQAKIAMKRDDPDRAKEYIDAAIMAYRSLDDEVGLASAWLARGEWFAARGGDHNVEQAIADFKAARRLEHDHLDRRGVALCNRKLAELHLERREFERAEDALEEAAAALKRIEDPVERAHVSVLWGRLWLAKGQPGEAATHLQRAFDAFRKAGRSEELADSRHLLVSALLATGRSADALEAMHDIGADDGPMYGVLLQSMHGEIAQTAAPSLRVGHYTEAVTASFRVLERKIRERAAKLDPEVAPPRSDKLHKHRAAWIKHGDDVPQIPGSMGLDHFEAFVQGSVGLLRNFAAHDDTEFSAADAFAAIGAAHLIVEIIDRGGLPWDRTPSAKKDADRIADPEAVMS